MATAVPVEQISSGEHQRDRARQQAGQHFLTYSYLQRGGQHEQKIESLLTLEPQQLPLILIVNRLIF